MKITLSKCTVTGILFVSIAGTLAHFLYEWMGKNILVGLFTPINEAVWEHVKLLFFPTLLFTAYACRFRESCPHIGYALCRGNLLGCLLIPTFYYTYTGALGVHFSAVDIAIFFLCVLITFLYAHRLVRTGRAEKHRLLPVLGTAVLAAVIFVFTLFPPAVPLFVSP
ncbi:MAG: hypothetical protein HDR11_05650 [Lachnospiraceae bacterium]|nr:hypothetical protein [Lachnospiraceae bacterium]